MSESLGITSVLYKKVLSGTTKSERTEPKSGCIESRWRLSSSSSGEPKIVTRNHLLPRLYSAVSGNSSSIGLHFGSFRLRIGGRF